MIMTMLIQSAGQTPTSEIIEKVQPQAVKLLAWAHHTLLSIDLAIQLGVIVLAAILALILTRHVRTVSARLVGFAPVQKMAQNIEPYASPLVTPLLLALGLLIGRYGLVLSEHPFILVRMALSLTAVWVLIRLVSNIIAEPFWARTAANIAWVLAALNIFGLLKPLTGFLGTPLGFKIGTKDFSALLLINGIILAIVLLWGASWLSTALRKRINTLPSLTPSVQLLLSKAVQITLTTAAILITLTSMGANLSSLAIVGGALSFGIGFGLQRIFANLISGVILLMDRSIKPGDVIEVGNTYGRVGSLGLRYTSVITRDHKEYLIPNEEFVVGRVVNWSYSDPVVRVKCPVGIAYNSDVRRAMALAVNALSSIDRVLKNPAPVCQLRGFGDSAINLEVRFWIRDAQNGVGNISSDVLLAIWDSFAANGVEFPFPQRDIHLSATQPLTVQIDPPSDTTKKP